MSQESLITSFLELVKANPTIVHLSCVANSLYAHELPDRPSLDDATKSLEDIKLKSLERSFEKMKTKYKKKQDLLQSRMKEGKSLTDEEEEWLDSEGNLIDGVLLMDKICSLPFPSGTKVLALKSTEIKTFLQILEFCFQLAATEEKKASENKRVKDIQAPKNRPNNVDKSKKPASKAADKPVRPKPVHAKPATKAEESKKQKQKEETSTTSKISNASNAEKVKVLDWHHKNRKNQSKTAVHFADIYPHWKIKQPLISKWLKDEESIQSKDIQKSNPSSKQIQLLKLR
ncbi:hypothetical protein KEM48_006677 [Puccinia striiformis f. sp. tritici PST-130]|nr:hypothetical protein Pst134EB_020375 [Puccinia striiformis f. sp. tritici]KAI9599751.1 hypothetical protein KEM48_006677 [Puccinia striiformis f. sp. tritici PST-130]